MVQIHAPRPKLHLLPVETGRRFLFLTTSLTDIELSKHSRHKRKIRGKAGCFRGGIEYISLQEQAFLTAPDRGLPSSALQFTENRIDDGCILKTGDDDEAFLASVFKRRTYVVAFSFIQNNESS